MCNPIRSSSSCLSDFVNHCPEGRSEMLLRSSSTPITSSFLSSFPDNTNNGQSHASPILSHFPSRKSIDHYSFLHMNFLSCSSSSPSLELRRVQSDGNLGDLSSDSSDNFDQLGGSVPSINPSSRTSYVSLEAIPSSRGKDWEEYYDYGVEDEQITDENLDTFNYRDRDFKVVDCDLKRSLGLGLEYSRCSSGSVESEMYLAKGLGIDWGGCPGQGYAGEKKVGDEGESNIAIEEYYRRELDENPGHPLLLRNYAEFLYHRKRDLQRAEHFFWRAMLADPKDGEVLSRYAMLVWELHHDKDRALSYFNRAIRAAPHDSHVTAAYASFLWEVEDCEDGDGTSPDFQTASSFQFNRKFASETASVY